jgi:hypothetical protein
MQGQDDFNMFPQYMTEPPAKRPRQCEHQTPMMPALPVEVAKGNNKYGSKGTVRCEKCQKRKGKVNIPLLPL